MTTVNGWVVVQWSYTLRGGNMDGIDTEFGLAMVAIGFTWIIIQMAVRAVQKVRRREK